MLTERGLYNILSKYVTNPPVLLKQVPSFLVVYELDTVLFTND